MMTKKNNNKKTLRKDLFQTAFITTSNLYFHYENTKSMHSSSRSWYLMDVNEKR